MLAILYAAILLMDLPAGETHLTRPLSIPKGGKHITVRANAKGSTLVMDPGFQGIAAIVADGVSDISFIGFEIRGNRTQMKSEWYLPLKEAAFADFYSDNGIVVRNSNGVTVRGVRFSRIRAFPLIVNASSQVTIENVRIEDCGTLAPSGRNNTTGGILIEEGTSHFEIRNSNISRVAGNAIWTHSYARSRRNSDGLIHDNVVATAGRDGIQVGHATRVRVERNRGSEVGFPADYVDVEHHGVGVALDTAGNVDHAVYARNVFTDVNGKCIDLDGFHDGEVMDNSCVNRKPLSTYPASHYGVTFGNNDPAANSSGITISRNTIEGFAYGAVYVIGSGNRIENNRFLDMNRAHCGVTPVTPLCGYNPRLLGTGIYLGESGGRPADTENNTIRLNTIRGFGMKERCIGGVNIGRNTISDNTCQDQ